MHSRSKLRWQLGAGTSDPVAARGAPYLLPPATARHGDRGAPLSPSPAAWIWARRSSLSLKPAGHAATPTCLDPSVAAGHRCCPARAAVVGECRAPQPGATVPRTTCPAAGTGRRPVMLAKLTPTTPEKRAPPLDLSPTRVVCLWLDEQEVEDKMRGNMVFLPLFAGILIFFNSFIPCPSNRHPNQGQTDGSF